jgi:ferritin-like metal-binding protein YciE
MKTLKHLFLEELQDPYNAERRLVKALPKMSKAATCTHLKAALLSHFKETEGHVKSLELVFQNLNEKLKAKTCQATVGLLAEGDEMMSDFKGSTALNAAIIAAAQKVEHYEMAS